ncbi:hypothetical protein BDY19DRAFT_335096 [Irpex rosettiformis]|uniref:Uncharacterized protein n=1 Tax=Irpex rosettiformis TaxID=378272 RepID=A0ACB8TY24_9APHY|nr:hypothetical protein BDY19DRAFT_335096 [Irpex rosettiformis]
MPQLELPNTQHFPSFRDLPNDNVANFSYYHQSPPGSPILLPTRHWVFLCEITRNISLMRPHFLVKDRTGTDTQVVFYIEGENQAKFASICSQFVVGNTLAVFYADSHYFMDGSVGLRVEDVSTVKVIPCSLERLLSTNANDVNIRRACSSCGTQRRDTDIPLRGCSRCKTKYCNQECQRVDWPRHKHDCVALQQVQAWEERDWRRFENYWDAF